MPDLTEKNKTFFNKILFIFISLIISYLMTATANYLNVFFPGYFIYEYNKYIFIIFIGLLLTKNITEKNHPLDIKIPALGYATLLTILILLHSIYPGNDNWYSVGLTLAKLYLYFILIINLLKTKNEYITFGTIFIVNIILLLILYISKLGEYESFIHSRLMSEEMGFNVNANSISYLAVLSLIIFSIIGKNSNKERFIFQKIFLFFLVLSVITINQSRGALIIMLLFILIESIKLKNIKALIVNSSLLIGIGTIIYYTLTSESEIFTTRISEIGAYAVRLFYIDDAIVQFWDNPLWGKGYDALLMRGNDSNHLWYLDVLVSYGIFGLILFLLCFFKIIHFRSILKSRFSLILSLYMFIYLFLAPPLTFFSLMTAFLYQNTKYNFG